MGLPQATAYQMLHAELEMCAANRGPREKPPIVDTRLALASNGKVVRRRWPEFYRAEPNRRQQP